MTKTDCPVRNINRYLSSFVGTPHLVFLKPSDHHFDGDSTQPCINVRPPVGVSHKSLATYPVDNEYIIFGFEKWNEAAAFALINRTEVLSVDNEEVVSARRAVDLAYVVWDVRTNAAHDRRNGRPERTFQSECDRKGLSPVSPAEVHAANQRADRSWPSTPF